MTGTAAVGAADGSISEIMDMDIDMESSAMSSPKVSFPLKSGSMLPSRLRPISDAMSVTVSTFRLVRRRWGTLASWADDRATEARTMKRIGLIMVADWFEEVVVVVVGECERRLSEQIMR